MSDLNHKNIIKFEAFFLEKEKKKAYLVSEFFYGKTLTELFASNYKFK